MFIFGAAKTAYAITKIKGLVKKSSTLAQAVKKFAGPKGLLEGIRKAARGFLEGNIRKYLSKTQSSALSSLSAVALEGLSEMLGIGGCISLVREML